MEINVEDNRCCLCQQGMLETHRHLFVECEYVTQVGVALLQWANISMPARELKSSSKLIKLKYWEKFKKEVMAAIWEQ